METNQHTVPRLPALLGYSGLLPFIVLSAALWLVPSSYQVLINQALLLYASLILAFMGAVHWGLAILQTKMEYLDPERVNIEFDLPLSELVVDYYDKLKSVTRGYASLDYEYLKHQKDDLIRLDILINGDMVDALTCIVHRENAYSWGLKLCQKLKELIPRQMFAVAIQAAVGTVTVFAFDQGQGLSEHSTPYDALVQVLDGKAEITIGGETMTVSAGESVLMPADIPHSLHAPRRYKMLLTMIRERKE